MLVYAGIDEAGYGPMLGPLCVACSVFILNEYDREQGAPNLWRLLNKAVCRSRKDSRNRVAVDDSKKLKGPPDSRQHPLKHLERGVLSFCSAQRSMADTDEQLFGALGARIDDAPWYRCTASPIPVGQTADELRIAASRVSRTMEGAGVSCSTVRCTAIHAGDFNNQVQQMGAKSNVNLRAVMQHVDAVWSAWATAHPHIVVDRQGGRTHYREELQLAYPDAEIQVLRESEALSRYHLVRPGGRVLTISFSKQAEDGHLPVALASMTAKYTRELMMLRLNRFFQGQMADLKPTAGYVQDARRYIEEIEPVVQSLNLPRRELIRSV